MLNGPIYTLVLQECLTVAYADQLHEQIAEALQNHAKIALDCSAATEMDVSFLQILLGASRIVDSTDKLICLSTPPSGLLAETITCCGFVLPAEETTTLSAIFSH